MTVNGVEIEFKMIDGVFTLKSTQEQMTAILTALDKTMFFDLREYTSVTLLFANLSG